MLDARALALVALTCGVTCTATEPGPLTDRTGSGDSNVTRDRGHDFSSSSSGSEEHDDHLTFVAILFPVVALLIGIASQWLLNKLFPFIPYTPFLLVVGFAVKMYDALPSTPKHVAKSIAAWEGMDGHLLLFLFLPPLGAPRCTHPTSTLHHHHPATLRLDELGRCIGHAGRGSSDRRERSSTCQVCGS